MSAVLVGFASTLTAEFSIQATLDRLVEQVVKVLPVTGAGLLLMGGEDHDHHFVAATDDVIRRIESLQLELGEGPCLQAYRTCKAVAVPDLTADRVFPRFSDRAVQAGLGAVFSFPLRLDNQPIGALELYSDEPARLSNEDLDAAQTLADVMAAYLYNARARSVVDASVLVLQEQALHDPLTGLTNRALLEDRLSQAVRGSQRSGALVGVLFMDVDGLKVVNDTYGHRAGDELLVGLARQVEAVLRPGDTLARLSGDEFVVVCEQLTSRRQGEGIAARILDALSEPIETGGHVLVASVSIGLAFAGAGVTGGWQESLADADAAMYDAKRQGGGRMSVRAPLP